MSQRALPTDLELTHCRQLVPRKEEKNEEKIGGMVPHPPVKTADRPLAKVLSEPPDPQKVENVKV